MVLKVGGKKSYSIENNEINKIRKIKSNRKGYKKKKKLYMIQCLTNRLLDCYTY